MFEFYSTPQDVLYFVLTLVAALGGLFLVIALFHLARILSNVNAVTSKAKDTIDLLNHYLWQPIKIAMMIIEKSKEVARHRSKKAKKQEESAD